MPRTSADQLFLTTLELAETQLTAHDPAGAATSLLQIWRLGWHPAIATALEKFPARPRAASEAATTTASMQRWLQAWRDADPLDVLPLLAELVAAASTEQAKVVVPRLDALAASAADPRILPVLLSLLRGDLTVRQTTRAYWKSLVAAVWKHVDPRARQVIETLSTARRTGYTATVRGQLSLISGLAFRRFTALTPLDETNRLRLIRIGAAAASMPVPARALATDDDEAGFVRRIQENPRDESLRLVFRDWLLDQSDPRAKTMFPDAPRALPRAVRARIMGGLAELRPSVVEEVVIERGFVVSATVKVKGQTRVNALMERPEWSTLERVRFTRDAALTSNLKALREARGVTIEALNAAVKRGSLPALQTLVVHPEALGESFDVLDVHLPALNRLGTSGGYRLGLLLEELAATPMAHRCIALEANDVLSVDRAWPWAVFDALPTTVREVVASFGVPRCRVVCTREADRWSATLEELPGTSLTDREKPSCSTRWNTSSRCARRCAGSRVRRHDREHAHQHRCA